MKPKHLKYLQVLCLLILVTGCGHNKLVCTMNLANQAKTITTVFGKEKVQTITITINEPSSKTTQDDIIPSNKLLVQAANNITGVKAFSQTKKKQIITNIIIDASKANDGTLEDLFGINISFFDNLELYKTKFINLNYKCK